MEWNAWEMQKALAGHSSPMVFPVLPDGWEARGVSTDTRTCLPGDLFVCLKGEKHDAHHYVEKVEDRVAGIIAERGRLAPTDFSCPVFEVEDTLAALQEMGRDARNRFPGIVLGITGSSGKTSAKEMLLGMCAELYGKEWVYATEGNLNNHIGVPLTLCRLRGNGKIAIVEMGMNHSGEISFLSRMARPHHALITSIAMAHAEFFSGIEMIAEAKLEILDGLEPGALLAFPGAAPAGGIAEKQAAAHGARLSLFRAENVSAGTHGIGLDFGGGRIENEHYFFSPMASNLAGCLVLLENLGWTTDDLRRAAARARPLTSRRFQVYRKGERILVDDTYNANPDSFERAVEGLRELLPEGRLVVFAGEMAELGTFAPEAHRAIGRAVARAGVELLVACGSENAESMKEAFLEGRPGGSVIRFPGAAQAVERVESDSALLNYDGILVKGSRSARMELVSDAIGRQGYV